MNPAKCQLDPYYSYIDSSKKLIGPLCVDCIGNLYRQSKFTYDAIIYQHAKDGAGQTSIAELTLQNGSLNPFLEPNEITSPSVFACVMSSCQHSLDFMRTQSSEKIEELSENLKLNEACASKRTYLSKESNSNAATEVGFTFRRHESTQTIESDKSLSFNGIDNDPTISAFVCHLNAKVGGPLSNPVFPILSHNFPFRMPRINLQPADSIQFSDPEVIHAIQRFEFIKNDLSLAPGMDQILPEELSCTPCGIVGIRQMKDLVGHNFSLIHTAKHMNFIYSRSMDLNRLIRIMDFIDLKIALQNIKSLSSEITDSMPEVSTGAKSVRRRMRLSCPYINGSIKLSLHDKAQLRVQEAAWQEEYRKYEKDLPSMMEIQQKVMMANFRRPQRPPPPPWLVPGIPPPTAFF